LPIVGKSFAKIHQIIKTRMLEFRNMPADRGSLASTHDRISAGRKHPAYLGLPTSERGPAILPRNHRSTWPDSCETGFLRDRIPARPDSCETGFLRDRIPARHPRRPMTNPSMPYAPGCIRLSSARSLRHHLCDRSERIWGTQAF